MGNQCDQFDLFTRVAGCVYTIHVYVHVHVRCAAFPGGCGYDMGTQNIYHRFVAESLAEIFIPKWYNLGCWTFSTLSKIL
jgi:hypothetical protein